MGFQIKNTDGKALSIKELDAEVVYFWGVSSDDKYYASPKPNGINWFDSVGYQIHNDDSRAYKRFDGVITWDMIREGLLNTSVNLLKDTCEEIEKTREYLKPYMHLITYWENKGYIPIRTKD